MFLQTSNTNIVIKTYHKFFEKDKTFLTNLSNYKFITLGY
jgi:hypothetical protein